MCLSAFTPGALASQGRGRKSYGDRGAGNQEDKRKALPLSTAEQVKK